MLRELEKYKKEDQKYEDVFPLVCHPKMLEIAFASLRRRRPGSVPKTLESNLFELVRCFLEERRLSREAMCLGESDVAAWRFQTADERRAEEAAEGRWKRRTIDSNTFSCYQTRTEIESSFSHALCTSVANR